MNWGVVRSIARMATYVAVAAVAYAVWVIVQLWSEEIQGVDATIRVLIALTVALCAGVPGFVALAMAKE